MDGDEVVSLRQKGAIDDPLTEILRAGARRLIAQAVEAEFETFLASNAELVLSDGRRRVVRHGHDPVRAIQTGIRPWTCKRRRLAIGARRRARGYASPRISCPNEARRTKSLDALCRSSTCAGFPRATSRKPFPHRYGKDAPNLSSAVIARLKGEWRCDTSYSVLRF